MKVIFYLSAPEINASSRYRVYKYLPYLKQKGIQYTVSTPASDRFFISFWQFTDSYLKKLTYYIYFFVRRLKDIIKAYRYDVVFIQAQLFPYGPPLFEKLLLLLNKNIIFDTDDANFVKPAFIKKNIFHRFKPLEKIPYLMRISSHVTVVNNYLKEYALKYNKNVTIIPMCIDADRYRDIGGKQTHGKDIIIGWTGTKSGGGVLYLETLKNVMTQLMKNYRFMLKIVSGDADEIAASVWSEGMMIEKKKWRLEDEISDLYTFDMGIVPLVKNEFEKGKFPFKALQYMAVGIPVIGTKWGMLTEIITDGENGFLADNDHEWLEKFKLLIEDPELRASMGKKGRELVMKHFSYTINAPVFMKVIESVSKNMEAV